MTGGYPLPEQKNRTAALVGGLLVAVTVLGGCSSNPADAPPPTIQPAQVGVSPPAVTAPAGQVLPLGGRPQAALFDRETSSLAVLTPGAGTATVSVIGGSGTPRTVALPAPATAICGDGNGTVLAATRGGFFTVDLRAGTSARRATAGWYSAAPTGTSTRWRRI